MRQLLSPMVLADKNGTSPLIRPLLPPEMPRRNWYNYGIKYFHSTMIVGWK